MNRKIFTSLLIIGMALAAMVGGTLAWFTAEAEITPNTFIAGTLEIDANETWDYEDEGLTNWNPGDCTDKEIEIEVTGTKRAFIRVLITESWEGTEDGLHDVVTNERDISNVNWWVGDKAWPGDHAEWQMLATADGTYWYYKGMFDPNEDDGPKKVTVLTKVCLAGAETGNEYQGATYTLSMNFEAIQVTHEAVFDVWGVGLVNGSWHEVEEISGVWTCEIGEDTYEWDPVTGEWVLI